jgi:DNA-binding protein HU-beta
MIAHLTRKLLLFGIWGKGRSPMNKTDLIDSVASLTGASKIDAGKAVDALLDAIAGSLQNGEEVRLTGFGSFSVAHRSARMGRNPRTGAPIHISASNQPKFKAGKTLKNAVND